MSASSLPAMHPTTPPLVVVPVAGEQELLEDLLSCLSSQTIPLAVTVVDDSPEGCLRTPEGIRTIRSGAVGPYAARNLGWRGTASELVLFCDVRSRPHPDWAERLARTLSGAGVAITASNTNVLQGPSWAARGGEHLQFFQLRNHEGTSGTRPFFPNCNLGVRQSVLAELGGFIEVRGGGDADLCWRAQELHGDCLLGIEDVLMDWYPRQTLRGLGRQLARYGSNVVRRRRRWHARGVPLPDPPITLASLVLLATKTAAGLALARVWPPVLDRALGQYARLCLQRGYRIEYHHGEWPREPVWLPSVERPHSAASPVVGRNADG